MFFYDCAVLRHIVVPPAVVVAVPMVVMDWASPTDTLGEGVHWTEARS